VNLKEFGKKLERLGPYRCYCCPGDISDRTARCISWRIKDRPKKTAAGRYPVYEMFPCEMCGVVKFHLHTLDELRKWNADKKSRMQKKA
jgi:hypothetical protein